MLKFELVKGKPFPSLIDVNLEDLSTGLENGQFTSVDLVNVRSRMNESSLKRCTDLVLQAYNARIQEVNSTLNVVIELNPDALTIAAQLDAERANGTTRG